MDTTKLQQYITDPNSITASDLTALHDSLKKYPYCSTLHILYIKALSNTNSIHFDEALRQSSVHVNDREQLFNIIHSAEEVPEIPSEKIAIETEVSAEKLGLDETPTSIQTEGEALPTDISAEATNPAEEAIMPEVSVEKEIEEAAPEVAKSSEEIALAEPINEVNESAKVNAEAQETDIYASALEKEMVAHAISADLLFDVDNIDKPLAKTITKEAAPIAESIELEFSGTEEKGEAELETAVENKKKEETTGESAVKANTVAPENLSFAEWLQYKKSGILPADESATTIIVDRTPEKEAVIEEPLAPVETQEPKLTKKEINQLLDKFIEEEPRLSKPKKEFYNPLSTAKKSLDDSDILVSETLAKIYHLQKNYSKAIKAYEQLSLLNPKKKSFFANQIKKIKKEELK